MVPAIPGHVGVPLSLAGAWYQVGATIQFPSVVSLGSVLPPTKKEEEEEEGFPVLSHLRIIFSIPCPEGDLCRCHRPPEPRCRAEGL